MNKTLYFEFMVDAFDSFFYFRAVLGPQMPRTTPNLMYNVMRFPSDNESYFLPPIH